MAEEPLVEARIEESIRLVKELDHAGKGPTNALWYLFEDAQEWRLLLAGPSFDAFLPKQEAEAYRQVGDAIRAAKLQTLTIADVKVVRTDHGVVAGTKFAIGTATDGIVRAHIQNSTFNGIFVKEMVILRASHN